MQHEPSFEELVDYAEGRLSSDQATRVSEHLAAGCAECARSLRWLERLYRLVRSDELVDAPQELVQRVQRMYRPRRPAVVRFPDLGAWRAIPLGVRIAAAVAAALVLVAGATWLVWGTTPVAQAATLADVQGLVEVRPPGATEWQLATPGMTLPAGSAIRSSEGGTAILAYADGSRTYLWSETQVEILSVSGRRSGQASSIRLSQVAGRAQHEVAATGSSLEVTTSNATAAASAASYEVWVGESGVEVLAERGEVTVRAGDTTAHLGEGEQGWVSGGQVVVATPPQPTASPPPWPTPQTRGPRPTVSVSPTAEPPTPEPTPPTRGRGQQTPQRTHTPPGQARRETPATHTPAAHASQPTATPAPSSTPAPSRTRPGQAHKTPEAATSTATPRPTMAPTSSPVSTAGATASPLPSLTATGLPAGTPEGPTATLTPTSSAWLPRYP